MLNLHPLEMLNLHPLECTIKDNDHIPDLLLIKY